MGDAIDPYGIAHLRKPKTGAIEPLLATPPGVLIDFAVSTNEVHIMTK